MAKMDLRQELLLDINGTALLLLKLVRIIYPKCVISFPHPWIVSPTGGIIKEISWNVYNVYIALKSIIPIYHNFYPFRKFGATGIDIRTKFNFTPASQLPLSGDFWTPLFARRIAILF